MAGPEWGEAHVEITADGALLDAAIKRMADQAGRTLARRINQAFNSEISPLGSNLEKQVNRLGQEMNKTERIVARLDRSFLKLWRTMPHGFRQFTFYTALFANLGESIAVLGSAAGAGLTVLGAAVTGVGIGLAVAITAFTGLTGAIGDLPAEIRPAVSALRRIGDTFGDLRRNLQIAVLQDTGDAFDTINDVVRKLFPALEKVGRSVRNVINSFARGIAPGTRNFENLYKIVDRSGPIFERTAAIVGTFAAALGSAFASDRMGQSVTELLGWLQTLADRFRAFTEGPGLEVWLDRASAVFGALGGLLDATGRALNNLVDDAAVERLVTFLEDLTGFMPSLERLLDVLGELNIFGLIAQALNDFGAALAPLHDPLMDLAGAVSDVISAGIDILADLFGDIAEALAPFVQGLADLVKQDPEGIAQALLAFAAAAVVVKGAQGIAGLATMVDALALSFKKMLALVPVLGLLTLIFHTLAFERDSDWFKAIDEAGDQFFNETVPGWFEGAQVALLTFVAMIVASLANGWNQIVSFFTTFGAIIAAAWTALWTGVSAFFTGIWNGIVTFITTAVTTVLTIILTVIGTLLGWWNGFWAGVFATVAAIWNNIISFIGFAVGAVVSFVTGVIGTLAGWWNGFWAGIFAVVSGIWNSIVSFVSGAINNVRNVIVTVAAGIVSTWNSIWSSVGSFFASLWGGIVSTARGAINTLIGIINGIIGPINNVLGAIRNLTGGLVNLKLPSLPKLAAGGLALSPSIVGEAGPELVIPLSRPLSMINPVARPFAEAIRNGGGMPSMDGGGKGGTTIMPGAIVVQTALLDPRLVGSAVLDAVVAKMP